MWLAHLYMPVSSNKHYIEWLCDCRAHCHNEYSLAIYNMGRLALPRFPTRVVIASIIPITVQLRCVPLLQQLCVCHLAMPTIPPVGPVLPKESATTLASRNRAVHNNKDDHAGNRTPPLCRLHMFVQGSKGWAKTMSVVIYSAAWVAWRRPTTTCPGRRLAPRHPMHHCG